MTAMRCRHTAHMLGPIGVRGRWHPNGGNKWEYCAEATRAREALARTLADAEQQARDELKDCG